jgi:hypothetical protein
MITSQEFEQLLKHTKYGSQFDDDSDGDQEVEATLPICLPTPLLLVGDDDSNPRSANTKPLPLSGGQPHGRQQHHNNISSLSPHPRVLSCTGNDNEFVSQSENNISDSPVAMHLCRASTPPPYTPADSTRVAAEVACCSAIEKTKVKTVMCLNYMHGRRCRFGAHCAFAHGAEELRQPPPEMMAKKQAIVSSSRPLLMEIPPPSYREALASPPIASPELGATPAYEDAVREQHEHLPPPPPLTDVLPSTLAGSAEAATTTSTIAAPFPAAPVDTSSKQNGSFPLRQRAQGSGGSARLIKSQWRRVKRSPL